MPESMRRPCASPGCTALVRTGYCAAHQRPAPAPSAERKARQRMYGRQQWQARRMQQLANHPWCEDCLRANIYTPATDVHHVDRHQGDALTFALSPLQSLCHACHSKHTAQEGRPGEGGQKRFLRGQLSDGGHPREKLLDNGESRQ